MSQPNPQLTLVKGHNEEALLESYLNSMAKALKALTFYPAGHPQRDESIAAAFNQLHPLLEESPLILLWSKDACTVTERAALKSTSITAKTLAREMLIRKLQRLTFLQELTVKDLKKFLTLFSGEASELLSKGGIEAEMTRAGITTIGANEVDLEVLRKIQQEAETQPEEDGATQEETPPAAPTAAAESSQQPELQEVAEINTLLAQLKEEDGEQRYLQLVRAVIDAADKLKKKEKFPSLIPTLETLLEEHLAEEKNGSQREYLKYALEQITDGSMTTFMLDQIEERSVQHEELLERLCISLGKTMAYPLIQRLCVAEQLNVRKSLAKLLTRTGKSGIPALIPMLKDERWYVVRNMVTILGEIALPDALKALQETAVHPEAKVRKEVIKALLKISTSGAEGTLIKLLDDSDGDVARQAVYSLGAIRSKAAVPTLLETITAPDAFLKELTLKKQAVLALGRIGDRQATAPLMDILTNRGWLAPGRWQELKITVATALGQLGDETAIPLLKKLSKQNTPLGKACGDAADNLERLAK